MIGMNPIEVVGFGIVKGFQTGMAQRIQQFLFVWCVARFSPLWGRGAECVYLKTFGVICLYDSSTPRHTLPNLIHAQQQIPQEGGKLS